MQNSVQGNGKKRAMQSTCAVASVDVPSGEGSVEGGTIVKQRNSEKRASEE